VRKELESLGPYKEKNKQSYEYKLVGVVVHYGTADYGHYYSYINVNRGNKENILDPTKDVWYEFNDSVIKKFQVSDIDKNCFGGEYKTDVKDDIWSWNGKIEKSQNAYILVYDKVVKSNL